MNSKSGLLNAISHRAKRVPCGAAFLAVALSLQAAHALPTYTLLLSKGDGPLENGALASDLVGVPAGSANDQFFLDIPAPFHSLWRYQSGLFSQIVPPADINLVSGGGGKYTTFDDVAPSGQLIVVNGPFGSTTYSSLYYVSGSSFSLIARTGSGAAGIPNSTIKSMLSTKLSTNGHGAYYALVTVPDSANAGASKDIGAVYAFGAVKPVAKDDDFAPGTGSATFTNLWTDSGIAPDNKGRVLLLGSLKVGVGDTTSLNDEGIWLDDALVLRAGDPAPGLPGGTIQTFHYSSFGNLTRRNGIPRINSNDKIAFVARINSVSGGTVIYLGETGTLKPILKPTDPAPGLPLETIDEISTYYLNDSDQVLFSAFLKKHDPTPSQPSTVDGTNSEILCLGTPEAGGGTTWKLLARAGQPVPEAPGLTFTSFGTANVTFGPLAQGSLFVNVASSTSQNMIHAILYFGSSGDLQTVAYEGQTIDLKGTPTLIQILNQSERGLTGPGHVVFSAYMGGSVFGAGVTTAQAKIYAASFGSAFPAPLPFATPTPTPPRGGGQTPSNTPPSITVAPKFAGSNGKARLKGVVSAGVVRVEIKVGKGKFKPAKLTGTSWKFAAKNLKSGKNAVTIVATNASGASTTTKTKIVAK